MMKSIQKLSIITLMIVGTISCSNNDESQLTTGFKPTDSSALIAYYPYNSNLKDASSNTLNGTATSPIYAADKNGNNNKALKLTGSTDQVMNTADLPIVAGSFSLSFWLYVNSADLANDSSGYSRYIIGSRETCNNSKFFNVQYTKVKQGNENKKEKILSVEIRNGHTNVFGVSKDNLPNNEWVHITITVDDTNNKSILYFNGVAVNETTWSDTYNVDVSNTAGLEVGNNICVTPNNASIGRMIAKIDEIALFSSVLTEDQIKDLAK